MAQIGDSRHSVPVCAVVIRADFGKIDGAAAREIGRTDRQRNSKACQYPGHGSLLKRRQSIRPMIEEKTKPAVAPYAVRDDTRDLATPLSRARPRWTAGKWLSRGDQQERSGLDG